jgi:hypothetical protein
MGEGGNREDPAREGALMDFDYTLMCLGSETLSRKVKAGGCLVCPVCDSWVKTPFSGQLVPVHARPYSEEEERDIVAAAASIIRFEYRLARSKGKLHQLDNRPGSTRWHATAMEMARPSRTFARTAGD